VVRAGDGLREWPNETHHRSGDEAAWKRSDRLLPWEECRRPLASFLWIIMVMLKVIQVGIVEDHFRCQSSRQLRLNCIGMPRIRHGVECPKCLTRYVVSCSPYRNGSYLLPMIAGCWDEYTLYCRCKAAASLWKSGEFKSYEVSAAAFERGYGTAEEITVICAP